MLSLFKTTKRTVGLLPPTQLLISREFATQKRDRALKFNKTPEKKKMTTAERRAQAQKAEAAKNWNLKSSGDKTKSWFPRFLLQGEQKELALKQVHRIPSLWEQQVAQRYQVMSSRRQRRMSFSLECSLRIRDGAISVLPPKLRDQVLDSGRLKHDVPISRRCATWTPPNPEYLFQ
ncbi:hypothetical protein BASA81_012605 [Batrachochytrium salamandrivorans]|nr:hypothetical protein BASA81_012605 [Batrachochytrium salamandrivorans]